MTLLNNKNKISVGGQALIEGIMMKGPKKTAIAVRTPDRDIDIKYVEEKHIKDKYPIFGVFLIRGVVNLIESMIEGYKALMYSADKSGMTDLEEENKKSEENLSPEEQEQKQKEKKKKASLIINIAMVVGSVLGVALSFFLFMYVPALLFDGLEFITKGATPDKLRPLFEGVLKIAVFVGYIAAVSKMNDIKRVFMYHGAEHKTIFCFEKGLELTVDNVRKQMRFHPRCGTSFMILMLVVSILVSLVTVTLFPDITKYRILWVLIKIMLVPLSCGVGYELIRVCGKYDNKLTRIIAAPGMWVQRLTTKEPEDDMIEVAIASIIAVLPKDVASKEAEIEEGLEN